MVLGWEQQFYIMGIVESKKDGIIRKFQLKINLKAQLKPQLLDLTCWSFADIKQTYDSHCRKGDCPFIDFFTFHKLMPFTTEVSRHVFASFAAGQQYINIFELVCLLILTSHNNYRKKLQFMFVIFDFTHRNRLTNRQLILIFESTVNAFCRLTGEHRPSYQYLARYTVQRYIRVNTLEALEKVVTYRRLIQEVQGNPDCFDLFKRFDQQIYGYFTQESYLFRVGQYKKYDRDEIDKMYRIVKKVNLDKNYEEVQQVEENRKFRLQNRKNKCIEKLLEEKEEKFKGELKTRSSSMILSNSRLPSIHLQHHRSSGPSPRISPKHQSINRNINSLSSLKSAPIPKTKIMILNGKLTNKQDIFQTIKYFKTLSGNKAEIKPKEFIQSFEKKTFIKKQLGSLYQFFDKQKKGQVNFQAFLRVYYPNITVSQIDLVKDWLGEFKTLHEADQFDFTVGNKNKDKKGSVELPRSTLARMDQIFNSIDQDLKGYLTISDLKKAYSTGFAIKELEDMMKQFGKNNKIYKQEFIRMTLPEDWTIEGTNFIGK